MSDKISRVVVLGGSPAGVEAAFWLRGQLPQAEIVLVEKGEIFAHSPEGMIYYLSADIEDFKALRSMVFGVVKDTAFYKAVKNIEVRTGLEPIRIDRKGRKVICRKEASGNEEVLEYDRLLIAGGRAFKVPAIPGAELPGVMAYGSPESALELRKAAESNKIGKVAVIGGGPVGCQLCEALKALWGIEVTLVSGGAALLRGCADADIARVVENELRRQGVEVLKGSPVKEVESAGDKLRLLLHSDAEVDGGFDRVVFAQQSAPDTVIAGEAGLDLGLSGGIEVDEYLRSSDNRIYAAGEAVELRGKLVEPGNFTHTLGRIAAENIAGKGRKVSQIHGSRLAKVFDMYVGAAGLTEEEAKQKGITVCIARGLFNDRAHYYPEVKLVSAKLIYSPEDGKILGFQAASKGYIARFIDTVSAYLRKGGTVADLKDHEPAFAPPLTDMEYPLHFLAYSAETVASAGLEQVSPLDFVVSVKERFVLDVREDYEVEDAPFSHPCQGVTAIPFTQLAARVGELDKSRKTMVVCPRGSRSCAAAVMLKKMGFEDVTFPSGGFKFFQD